MDKNRALAIDGEISLILALKKSILLNPISNDGTSVDVREFDIIIPVRISN